MLYSTGVTLFVTQGGHRSTLTCQKMYIYACKYIYIYMCVCVCVCVCVRTKKANNLTPFRTVSYTVKLWPKSIEFVRE